MSTVDDPLVYTNQWLPSGDISFVILGSGQRLRYIKTGSGPDIVLLHTVRTQLDLFQRVVPLLAQHFTVHAFDLPGFGWSDIEQDVLPSEPNLRARMKEALDRLGIRHPILVGESIGATLSLSVAADLGDAVAAVVAFNTYDYLPGLERANLLASVIVKSVRAPVIGPIFAALENRPILAGILNGGVHEPKSWPAHLIDEFRRVGRRPGYANVSRDVYRALPTFVAARPLYQRIVAPVTLVWGAEDWSRPIDRTGVERAVPQPKLLTIPNAGHFISIEKPREFADIVVRAASSVPSLQGASRTHLNAFSQTNQRRDGGWLRPR